MRPTQLSSFPNGTLATAVEVVLEAIHKSGIAGLTEHPKVINLSQAGDNFSVALGKKLKSDLTAQLKVAGDALATPYKGLQFAIKGLTCSLDSGTKALGEKMNKRLADYAKGVNPRSAKRRAAYMKALVTEFRKPEYAAATTILPYLADMETVFENYKQLFVSRRADRRAQKNITAASDLRKPLMAALKSVLKYVEGMSVATDLAAWDVLFVELSDCIRAISISNQRPKAAESSATGEATPAA
jgi:Family of unknown function (DUF6261)